MIQKFLFVFPSINAGGAEKAAIVLANELVKINSYSVAIIVFNKSNFYEKMIDERISVIYLNNSYRDNFFDPIKSYILFPIKLILNTYYVKYDFIVSIHEYFGEWPVIISFPIFKLINFKVKFISFIQRSIIEYRNNTKLNRGRRYINIFIDLARNNIFFRIICVSNEIYHSIKSEKKRFLPNPVSILSRSENEIISEDNFIEQFSPYYINVARIAKQKNQLLLLKVIKRLIDNRRKVNLLIIGEITEMDYYKKLINYIKNNNLVERVKIIKPVLNIDYYLKKSSAHIFSSLYEGMPLAVLESMMLSVPIISSRFVGIESFLNENQAILYDTEDELYEVLLNFDSNNSVTDLVNNSLKEVDKYLPKNLTKNFLRFINE